MLRHAWSEQRAGELFDQISLDSSDNGSINGQQLWLVGVTVRRGAHLSCMLCLSSCMLYPSPSMLPQGVRLSDLLPALVCTSLITLLIQVSFNVANTPEQIYWNQKKVREAFAKAGGVLPNSVSYYQVLPSADEFGRAFTTVRFVVNNRNPELATNLLTSLNDEKTQNNLKNRIEDLNLDMIGDSMKAQTPTDYKASARGSDGPLPSSTMMDTTGGMNGAAGAAAGAAGAGPADSAPLPGTSAAAGSGGAAAGNATSTAGLPGLPTGSTSPLAARRAATSAASSPAAAAGALLMPVLLAAGALLL